MHTTLGSETTHRSIERRPNRNSTTIRSSKHDSLNSQVRRKVTRMRADYTQGRLVRGYHWDRNGKVFK